MIKTKKKRKKAKRYSWRCAPVVVGSMKIKGLKKRLKALQPKEKPKEIPKWCYDYVDSITPERWIKIAEAIDHFKRGINNPQTLNGDDRAFYERVIEASREGIIEL